MAIGTWVSDGVTTETGFEGPGQIYRVIGTAAGDVIRYSNEASWGSTSHLYFHFDGGAGVDTVEFGTFIYHDYIKGQGFFDLSYGVTADLAAGQIWGISTDTITGIENLTGTAQNDTLRGDAGDNVLHGGAGDDNLQGREGNDWLQGGEGNDTLRGGAGDDQLDGGSGFDLVMMDGLTFFGSGRALSAEGLLQLTTAEGTDTLSHVEEVRFLDGHLVLGADASEAMVARLYALALDRAPDAQGLTYWSAQVEAGASLAVVADGLLGSQEFSARHGQPADNVGFVHMLYSDLLGRGPDAAGATFWEGLLAAGTSRGAVLASFSESLENRALTADMTTQGFWRADAGVAEVARLYDTLLGRAPDAGGLASFATFLQTGGNSTEVARHMLASAEYRQNAHDVADDDGFVASLYATALDRTPDDAEVAFWSAALSQGISRADLALAFSESGEHVEMMRPVIDNGILIA
jgi:hypothetical protein